MRVFSISEAGEINDITEQTHCISAESRLLKTSPTCSLIYVDGTEKRGADSIEIHIQFNQLHNSAKFRVWFPQFPIKIALSDPILNRISKWKIENNDEKHTKNNKYKKKKRFEDSKTNHQLKLTGSNPKCQNRWQKSEVINEF